MTSRKKLVRRAQDPQVSKGFLGDFYLEDAHLYRLDRPSFTIHVGGDTNAVSDDDLGEPGVEYHMADRFEINLATLSGIDSARPILVNMSSCGGHWEDGMKMAGAILHCPNPVTVLGTKWCRSMTSLIPLFADRFIIRPPAQYMFHYGTFGFSGIEQEMDTADIERRKAMEMMLRIYIARLKSQGAYRAWSEEKIREMLQENMRRHIDVWLSADEAKRWGFADHVLDPSDVLGDHKKTFRATSVNLERRKLMSAVLRKKPKVDIKIS